MPQITGCLKIDAGLRTLSKVDAGDSAVKIGAGMSGIELDGHAEIFIGFLKIFKMEPGQASVEISRVVGGDCQGGR